MEREMLARFPSVMQKAFQERGLSFPQGTRFQYKPFVAYRVIYRHFDENLDVTFDDFRSYAEQHKLPHARRGVKKEEVENNPKYYGVSLFRELEVAKTKFHLPKYPKRIARGYVIDLCGPEMSESGSHVTWWLYENADISKGKFEVMKDE